MCPHVSSKSFSHINKTGFGCFFVCEIFSYEWLVGKMRTHLSFEQRTCPFIKLQSPLSLFHVSCDYSVHLFWSLASFLLRKEHKQAFIFLPLCTPVDRCKSSSILIHSSLFFLFSFTTNQTRTTP